MFDPHHIIEFQTNQINRMQKKISLNDINKHRKYVCMDFNLYENMFGLNSVA